MTETKQYDPNIPDPDKPWCLRCESHSQYTTQRVRAYSKYSSAFRNKYTCKICTESNVMDEMSAKNEMFIPSKIPDNLGLLSFLAIQFPVICMLAIPLFIFSIALVPVSGELTILVLAVNSFFFFIWALIGWHGIRLFKLRRKKWVSWTSECSNIEN